MDGDDLLRDHKELSIRFLSTIEMPPCSSKCSSISKLSPRLRSQIQAEVKWWSDAGFTITEPAAFYIVTLVNRVKCCLATGNCSSRADGSVSSIAIPTGRPVIPSGYRPGSSGFVGRAVVGDGVPRAMGFPSLSSGRVSSGIVVAPSARGQCCPEDVGFYAPPPSSGSSGCGCKSRSSSSCGCKDSCDDSPSGCGCHKKPCRVKCLGPFCIWNISDDRVGADDDLVGCGSLDFCQLVVNITRLIPNPFAFAVRNIAREVYIDTGSTSKALSASVCYVHGTMRAEIKASGVENKSDVINEFIVNFGLTNPRFPELAGIWRARSPFPAGALSRPTFPIYFGCTPATSVETISADLQRAFKGQEIDPVALIAIVAIIRHIEVLFLQVPESVAYRVLRRLFPNVTDVMADGSLINEVYIAIFAMLIHAIRRFAPCPCPITYNVVVWAIMENRLIPMNGFLRSNSMEVVMSVNGLSGRVSGSSSCRNFFDAPYSWPNSYLNGNFFNYSPGWKDSCDCFIASVPRPPCGDDDV